MTPQQAFNALMNQQRVKLTDEYFKTIREEYSVNPLEVNDFSIYQIEECCVNLFSRELDTIMYEIPFDYLLSV